MRAPLGGHSHILRSLVNLVRYEIVNEMMRFWLDIKGVD